MSFELRIVEEALLTVLISALELPIGLTVSIIEGRAHLNEGKSFAALLAANTY